jgi:hypothetical protein
MTVLLAVEAMMAPPRRGVKPRTKDRIVGRAAVA